MARKTPAEPYEALVQLWPAWFESLLAFQVAADWSRTNVSAQTLEPGCTRRIVGTCTVRVNRQRKPDLAPVPPIAGAGWSGPRTPACGSATRRRFSDEGRASTRRAGGG